jgi:hypothetical protein
MIQTNIAFFAQDINGVATILRLSIWGDLSPRSSNTIGVFCFLAVAVFCLKPLSLPDSLHGFPLRSCVHNLAHLALFAAGFLSMSALVDAFIRSVARALRVDELGMRDAFLEIAAWLSPVVKVHPPLPRRVEVATRSRIDVPALHYPTPRPPVDAVTCLLAATHGFVSKAQDIYSTSFRAHDARVLQ